MENLAPLFTLHNIALFLLTTLLILTSWWAIQSRAKLESFHPAVVKLYIALITPIIDYSLKITASIKNTFWFPLGIDHRVFKHSYKKLTCTAGYPAIIEIENPKPIYPKSPYLLLSLTVWCISIYIWFALTHSFHSIYGKTTDLFIKTLPLLLAGVVLLLDTWIIRTHSVTTDKAPLLAKVIGISLRLIVSSCIALIAAFHFLSITYTKDIQEASKKNEHLKTLSTIEYAKFNSLRNSFTQAYYQSEATMHCLRFISKGSNTISKGTKNGKPEDTIFPAAKFNEIFNNYRITAEIINNTPPPNIVVFDCKTLVKEKEEECPLAKADAVKCPRLTSNAKEGFIRDIDTFGTKEAISRHWYGITDVYRDLLTRDKVPADLSKEGQVRQLIQQIDKEKDPNSDIATAADVISEKIINSPKLALALLFAPIIILMVFEFSVIISKSMIGHTSIDSYLSAIDKNTFKRISTPTTPFDQNTVAELNYSSEYSIQDHIGNIILAISEFILPLIKNPKFASLLIIPIIVFIAFIASQEAISIYYTFVQSTSNLLMRLAPPH